MNVSKIGVTQVLPKSSPLYKSFRIAEIRKKILKDLKDLMERNPSVLVKYRNKKIRNMGNFNET